MQQMREAFPWDQAPRYVLRDRDAIYGSEFAAMTCLRRIIISPSHRARIVTFLSLCY